VSFRVLLEFNNTEKCRMCHFRVFR